MRAIAKWKYVQKSALKDIVDRKHQDGLDLSVLRTPNGRVTATDQETHKATTLGFKKVFNSEGLHPTDEWEKCMQD